MPDLKPGTFDAAMCIEAPVCGFLPSLAALCLTEKVPKPLNSEDSEGTLRSLNAPVKTASSPRDDRDDCHSPHRQRDESRGRQPGRSGRARRGRARGDVQAGP